MVLLYLKARGYNLMVITDGDDDVEWMAMRLNIPLLPNVDFIRKVKYDLFICCHGRTIIPDYLLSENMVNIHPTDYNGHNPVKKYIQNEDTKSCIRAMYMIDKVDEGEEIARVCFETGKISSHAEYYNIALKEYLYLLDDVLKIVL